MKKVLLSALVLAASFEAQARNYRLVPVDTNGTPVSTPAEEEKVLSGMIIETEGDGFIPSGGFDPTIACWSAQLESVKVYKDTSVLLKADDRFFDPK